MFLRQDKGKVGQSPFAGEHETIGWSERVLRACGEAVPGEPERGRTVKQESAQAVVPLVMDKYEGKQMESITQSAAAGLIAALAATAILGVAKYVRQWLAKRQDERYIRNLLVVGRRRVMGAEDTLHKTMNATSSADSLRAAQYNLMIRQLDVALKKWMVGLSHGQRKGDYISGLTNTPNPDMIPIEIGGRNNGEKGTRQSTSRWDYPT